MTQLVGGQGRRGLVTGPGRLGLPRSCLLFHRSLLEATGEVLEVVQGELGVVPGPQPGLAGHGFQEVSLQGP